jgi:hypothetical protein
MLYAEARTMSGNQLDQRIRWNMSALMRARLDNRIRFRSGVVTRCFRAARRLSAIAPQSPFDSPRIVRGTD